MRSHLEMSWPRGEWADVPSGESGDEPRATVHEVIVPQRGPLWSPHAAASPDLSLCRGGVQREWWKECKNEGDEGAGKLDPWPQLGFGF